MKQAVQSDGSSSTQLDPLQQSFTRWLFRAYLDLGPVPVEAPHHLHGLDFGIHALMEDTAYPRIQSALNPSFRDALVQETGLAQYNIKSPSELPSSLRQPRWTFMCEQIQSFESLSSLSQVRLAWLLGKLCLQDFLLELVPEIGAEQVASSNENASLAYLRAYSRCRLNIDDAANPYSLDEFKEIALHAPPGIARIDAHYQMISQSVKARGDLTAADYWQEKHLQAIESSRSEIDEFNHLLVMSRYHRVGGFLPQMRKDVEGVVREMDLAEQYALALPRRSEPERIAADEMLYPVYESRTKEALWLEDFDLAEERALKTVALSPYDARAWLHLGQVYCDRENPEDALRAYLRAVRLAPPGAEIAWFMAGQCYEALDDLESACNSYLASLQTDPLGLSAVEQLVEVSQRLGHSAIFRWAQGRLEQLQQRVEGLPEDQAEPYKLFAKPGGLSAERQEHS